MEYLPFGPRDTLAKVPFGFSVAQKVAGLGTFRYRLGCALFENNKTLVSVGINQVKTHPTQLRYSNRGQFRPYLHAEIHALCMARKEVHKGTAYIARLSAKGMAADSRPCSGCQLALTSNGFRYMVYHLDGNLWKEEL